MRVAIVPSWYPSLRNPIRGVFVREQVRVLASSTECEVAVVIPYAVGREALSNGAWLRSSVVHTMTPYLELGVRVARRPQAFMSDETFIKRWTDALVRGLHQVDDLGAPPQLIHAHVAWPAGVAVMRAASRVGLPFVLTEHTAPFSALLQVPEHVEPIAECLSQAAAVVAVSPGLREEMSAFVSGQGVNLGAPIEVVGNVVDESRFLPAADRRRRNRTELLCVGNLVEKKAHDVLLDAFAQLLATYARPVHLTIIGSGPRERVLRERIHSLDLERDVLLVPAATGDALLHHYQNADVFVQPSLVETFGVVVAEAMACGLPAVVTRSGGPEWFVEPSAGVVVEPGSPEALCEGLLHVLCNLDEYDPATIRSLIVDRFGRAAFVQNIVKVYSAALSREFSVDRATKHRSETRPCEHPHARPQ